MTKATIDAMSHHVTDDIAMPFHRILTTMDKRSQELSSDILKYNEIVSRSKDLEKDIPPKRGNWAEKPRRSARIVKKSRRRQSPRQKAKEKKKPHRPAKDKKKLHRPAYSFTRVSVKREEGSENALMRAKAKSFEQQVITQNSYTDLIRIIRNQSDLDFSMMCKLLPKNLDYEKERFRCDNAGTEPLVSMMNASVFSNDIDQFFRQLSDVVVPFVENSVPLV